MFSFRVKTQAEGEEEEKGEIDYLDYFFNIKKIKL